MPFFFENKKSPSSRCWRERRGDPTTHRAPPQKKKRASKKDAESDGDDSDGSDDSEEEDDGKDLLKKKWMDEELDAECTVTRRTRFQGQRALWYTYVDEDGDTQKEKSSVEEVREWIQQFGS